MQLRPMSKRDQRRLKNTAAIGADARRLPLNATRRLVNVGDQEYPHNQVPHPG